MPGDPAPTPNDNWVCHAKLYNDGRTCDCRCGLPDPDCLFPNLPVKNCGSEEVCSAVGRCTTPEASAGLTDTSSVYISEPCSALFLPGSTGLSGYMGTEAKFREASGDTCYTCPYDPSFLYGGAASRSEVCGVEGCLQEYVCRYKAEGYIDARDVRRLDDLLYGHGETFDLAKKGFVTTQGGTLNASKAYRLVVVKLGSRSPFPYNAKVAYKMDIDQDSTDIIVSLEQDIYYFPYAGPYVSQIDAIAIQFQQSSQTQSHLAQRLVLEKPMELNAGYKTALQFNLEPSVNTSANLSLRNQFESVPTLENYWYPKGTTIDGSTSDMLFWQWPKLDPDYSYYGVMLENHSLAFTMDAGLFVDKDQGFGCSQAYDATSATMNWAKIDTDADGTADTWVSLFGQNGSSLCDGIHDGHAVVTDTGLTEAVAYASLHDRTVQILIRDLTATDVTKFDVRTVKAAWKAKSPVWWPDDVDNCWTTNTSMEASDHCSCKDTCECLPGCSAEDCAQTDAANMSYTCGFYFDSSYDFRSARIQVKGKLRWLPEDWSCPDNERATASYFADGVCDCGCARYDPDCAGQEGNPKTRAESLAEATSVYVRNYCADQTALLGSNGVNLKVNTAGCQGYWFVPLGEANGTDVAAAPAAPFGFCLRTEEKTLDLNMPVGCEFESVAGWPGTTAQLSKLTGHPKAGKEFGCTLTASGHCYWTDALVAKHFCSQSTECKAVSCFTVTESWPELMATSQSYACFAAPSNASAWTDDDPNNETEGDFAGYVKNTTRCNPGGPDFGRSYWKLGNAGESCSDVCSNVGKKCDEVALNYYGTLDDVQFMASEASATCTSSYWGSYQQWAFSNSPGQCDGSNCCGAACAGLCVFGHTGTTRTCNSSADDEPNLKRFCPCFDIGQKGVKPVEQATISVAMVVPEGQLHDAQVGLVVVNSSRDMLVRAAINVLFPARAAGQWPTVPTCLPDGWNDTNSSAFINFSNLSTDPMAPNFTNVSLICSDFNMTAWSIANKPPDPAPWPNLTEFTVEIQLPEYNSTELTSSWHMSWEYMLLNGSQFRQLSECPTPLQGYLAGVQSMCSFEPAWLVINDVYMGRLYLWASPNASNTNRTAIGFTSSLNITGSADTCDGCSQNMSIAINLLNNKTNKVTLMFEQGTGAQNLLVKSFKFHPTCQVAMQDISTYRYCTTFDPYPTWDISKITQTSLYSWQRERLEVLSLDYPVSTRRDRGTTVETVAITVNMTNLNPFNLQDVNLTEMGIQNDSGTSARRLGEVTSLPAKHFNALSAHSGLTPFVEQEEGVREDLRGHTDGHSARHTGTAAEMLARVSAFDEVPPELVSADLLEGHWDLRLRFSERVFKAPVSMAPARLHILPSIHKHSLPNLGLDGVLTFEVDLFDKHKVTMEANGLAVAVNIHQQLLSSGCDIAGAEHRCEAVLEVPAAAFVDRNRNPSPAGVVVVNSIGPLVNSAKAVSGGDWSLPPEPKGVAYEKTVSNKRDSEEEESRRLADVAEVFRALDTNADGLLSSEELAGLRPGEIAKADFSPSLLHGRGLEGGPPPSGGSATTTAAPTPGPGGLQGGPPPSGGSAPTPAAPTPGPGAAPTPAAPTPGPGAAPTPTSPTPAPAPAPKPAAPTPGPGAAPTPASPTPAPAPAPTPATPTPAPAPAPTPAAPTPGPGAAPTPTSPTPAPAPAPTPAAPTPGPGAAPTPAAPTPAPTPTP
ncbi:unnamed protein product [Polarella glacialis]|uniref:EF-hand domain-containing protein n=1 Tax=Polarella glacialis TaxID=89957 RepID=A0A813LAP3_POLGL|nr:unnamed protein product [Polarella glacialis]